MEKVDRKGGVEDIVNGMPRSEWNKRQREAYYKRRDRYYEKGLTSLGKPFAYPDKYRPAPRKCSALHIADEQKPRKAQFATKREWEDAVWRWQKARAEASYEERMRAKLEAMREIIKSKKQQQKQ